MRPRLLKVKSLPAAPEFPALPPGAAWSGWPESLAEEIARATVEAYRGSPDAVIWRELQDAAACAAWLRGHRDHLIAAGTGVIRQEGETLAAVVTVLDPHMPEVAEILSIAVNPEARGLRLGDALIRISEWSAWQAGIRMVKLLVDARNERLASWYQRLGYVTVDEKWVRVQADSLPRRVARAVRRRLLGK